MKEVARWGKGTAAHYQTACPLRYFKPASRSELDGVSLVGGVPDKEGGYRLRATDTFSVPKVLGGVSLSGHTALSCYHPTGIFLSSILLS